MLKPLGDKVLVKMVELEEVTKGGIVLPNQAKEKSQIAEVIAAGPGKVENGELIKMEVCVGQKVIVSKYSGTEVKYMNEEYLIIGQNDILAIVE